MTAKLKIEHIIEEYRLDIKEIDRQDLNDFSVVEKGIQISRKCLKHLRGIVRDNDFKTIENEIHFFKYQKPFVYSRLKYYAKLYNFLLERPAGSIKSQRIFIDQEIEKLQKNYRRNLDFVKYFREGDTTLDHYYFVRGNDNLSLVSDTSHFYTDDEFSTSHDNAMAKIMAYDLLVNYYNQELVSLGLATAIKSNVLHPCSDLKLEWTATKTDLIELIYALQASGAIKDGRAGIKDMATACEQMFNIDLGHYYRTYVEIRERKMDRARFILYLKQSLDKRMTEDDNRS